jgi:anti-sigma B factor antagonist
MTIERAHLSGGPWLVTASGRLDQSQAGQLEEILQALLKEGRNQLIVDMAAVDYINSGGLRCLVTAWRMARQENGDVLLCSMTPRVYDIFKMIGFDKVFRIFPNRDEASQYWQQSG